MDILVKEGEIIKVINILDCVKTLREQRDNMVQTVVNIANEPVSSIRYKLAGAYNENSHQSAHPHSLTGV